MTLISADYSREGTPALDAGIRHEMEGLRQRVASLPMTRHGKRRGLTDALKRELVETPNEAPKPASSYTLVGPLGLRIDGLDPRQVAELWRALC